MSKVIIINGPSCAGKTTIANEICRQSDNKFVHLQIDKAGEFYSTIFPKGFVFAENEIGTENNDDGLKGLFNNNRLARRLDGPDAKKLAQIYLAYIDECEVKFVGIYCPVEERLKMLKTRKDNLFLTEDFIRNQTDQYDVFESCKEFYDVWFYSSLLNGGEIVKSILEHKQNAQQGTVPQFVVRTSQISDIDTMVSLSKAKRLAYEKAQPQFWRYAGEEGDNTQRQWFTELLEDENHVMFIAESDTKEILGFVIGKLMSAPEVYNPGGLTLMIDDFCVQSENLWQSIGLIPYSIRPGLTHWPQDDGQFNIAAELAILLANFG